MTPGSVEWVSEDPDVYIISPKGRECRLVPQADRAWFMAWLREYHKGEEWVITDGFEYGIFVMKLGHLGWYAAKECVEAWEAYKSLGQ